MKLPFEGQCACGEIRYRATAQPGFSWICHCRDCQRASGSAYCSILYVPGDAMEVRGTARYYTVSAESGNQVSRGFCPTCGSPMFILADLVPDLQGVWATSLDEPAQFSPVVQVWCVSGQPWGTLHPDLNRIAKAPSAAEFSEIPAASASGPTSERSG
jgi:hypothetical protein